MSSHALIRKQAHADACTNSHNTHMGKTDRHILLNSILCICTPIYKVLHMHARRHKHLQTCKCVRRHSDIYKISPTLTRTFTKTKAYIRTPTVGYRFDSRRRTHIFYKISRLFKPVIISREFS